MPPSDLKLVGFDFDLTLSSRRVYGRSELDHLQDLFGGSRRIALLQQFFHFLVEEHGVRIIIISWNYREIIEEVLDNLGLLMYVHSVYDRPSMKLHGGYQDGKRNIISDLSKKWHLAAENVVFVDDSQQVLSGMTCHQVLVKGKTGLTLDDMRLVATALGLNFDSMSFRKVKHN